MEPKEPYTDLFKPTPLLPILLQIHRVTARTQVDSFINYIIDSRQSIKKMQEDFNKSVEEEAKKHPQEEQEIYEWYEDQYYQYSEVYPVLFMNSTALSLYSFFEFNLKSLCHTLYVQKKYSKNPDKLTGNNYIEKSKRYLKLYAGIDLTDIEKLWQEITKFQKIRNCIVHNNSNIIKNKGQKIEKQPLYQIIKKNKNLELNKEKGTFIIKDDQFLLDFCDIIEKYFVSVVEKLEKVI